MKRELLRKTHSSALDAFEAAEEATPPCQPGERLVRTAYGVARLATLSMAPGLSESLIAHVLADCDGVVLRAYGSGTVPDSPALHAGLRAAEARGAPVIAVSQCPEGGIALGTYAAGAMLVETGVIDGRDMTVEAAYAKLAHVLAHAPDPASRRARLARILCGEATATGKAP
jgi:L-asparaginase